MEGSNNEVSSETEHDKDNGFPQDSFENILLYYVNQSRALENIKQPR